MVADVVRAVAGERAEVVQLLGSGTDPHLYTPTREDVVRVRDADFVFYNGLLLEGRLSDSLVRAPRSLAVAEALSHDALLDDEDEDGFDPHVWMDVRRWMGTVDAVRDALSEFDPEGAAEYARNAAAYREQLAALDEHIRRTIASIPERRRVMVTAHDAFGYFGDSYGIEVIGIQGMSTDSEAGLRRINRLVDRVVTDEIPAVFVESTLPERNVRALVEGAASRGHRMEIGGTLFSDAMGPGGTYEGTYIGMMDHNANVIARALGGDASSGGFAGTLKIAGNDSTAGSRAAR